jgi:hypothetical protein
MTNLVGRAATITALMMLAACGTAPSNAQAPSTPSAVRPTIGSSPSPSPSAAASPSPSASPSQSPTASTMPTPVASPSIAANGPTDLTSCPPYAAGQHPLGAPGPPGAGVYAEPTLDWSGCGTLTLPPGSTRFRMLDNWQLGFAATCPNDLSYGTGGMGPSVTFSEIIPSGTVGPDTAGGAGPWTDLGNAIMAHGGDYQLRVTSIDHRCRWHVAIYPNSG